MNVNFRNFAIWLVILFMLMGLFQVFQSTTRNSSVSDKTYSQFISDVDAGSVTSVTIVDNVVQGVLKDGSRFETTIPNNTDIVTRLEDRGVQITAKSPESSPSFKRPSLPMSKVWTAPFRRGTAHSRRPVIA